VGEHPTLRVCGLTRLRVTEALFAGTDEDGLAGSSPLVLDGAQFPVYDIETTLVDLADIVAGEEALGLVVLLQCAVVLVLEEFFEEGIGEAFEVEVGLGVHLFRFDFRTEAGVTNACKGNDGEEGHPLS